MNAPNNVKTVQAKPQPARQPLQQYPIHQRTVQRVVAAGLEEECYAMDQERRGICLIFENDQFQPSLQLSSRRGSELDLKAANDTFTALGFEVLTFIFQ